MASFAVASRVSRKKRTPRGAPITGCLGPATKTLRESYAGAPGISRGVPGLPSVSGRHVKALYYVMACFFPHMHFFNMHVVMDEAWPSNLGELRHFPLNIFLLLR